MRSFVFVVAAAFILSACGENAEREKANKDALTEIKLQRLIRSYVSANLRDPDSAQFRNQKGQCGEVNAKNGFGGMSGYVRFIAAKQDLVFMENDPNIAPGAFDQVWNQFCR